MSCISWNCGGWKCMTVLTVFEMLVALFGSVSWGTGFTEHLLKAFLDPENCTEPCLQAVHMSVEDWQIWASVLYGIAVLFSIVTVLGLLSGQLWLQVPNVVFSILKIVITIYICENLLNAEHGPKLYKANRVFMYGVTLVNIVTLCLNGRQVLKEIEREEMERSGRRSAEIRPLTQCIATLLQNCNSCCRGNGNGNTYEVNSNEIRVPILDDSPDSGNSQNDTSGAPLLNPKIAGTAVAGNAPPPVVEALIPAGVGRKHSVVDMGEESSSGVENLNVSVKSGVKNLKDSAESRPSREESLSKAGESRKRKSSREANYSSGEESRSGKSTNDSREESRDICSQDEDSQNGESRDETPL